MSDINAKVVPSPSGVKATSVNYDNLGDVFTKVSAWDGYDPRYIKPDQLNIDIESAVYSVVDGVSGWALKTILGYELNGEIVQDDTGNPEVVNYADEICKRHKAWTIAKTHEPQTIRCFVKSVGQDTGGQPNVAAYPLGNEVSVNLTIPARTSYTVTFNANGGENAPAAQTKWHNETLILSGQKPTRTDYVFMGWSKTKREPSSDNYAIDYAAGASSTENANTTLYAVWKPRPFVIQYDANGGTGAPADQTKEHGQSINLHSTIPTRQGYAFQGWATSATGTPQYQPGATYNGNANLSLFAIWKIITYTITYNANGGTGAPANQTKEYGKSVVLSTGEPSRDNYDFLGWSTTKEQQDIYNKSIYIDNKNLNLYAIWQSRATKYMKTLNGYEICDESARELAESARELSNGIAELSKGIVTSGTGSAYTASVKAIDALTNGVSFIMIPHATNTTTSPTLNVNNLGAKTLRQRLSDSSGNSVALVESVLLKDKPVRVMYDGAYWIVDMPKPVATKLDGIVPVASGGTGASTAAAARTNLGINLNNLGITWGTGEAPSTGTPNTIYIQIN